MAGLGEVELKQLHSGIRAIEVDMEQMKSTIAMPSTPQSELLPSNVADQLKKINSGYDDAENRLRRSNLLLFGIPDDQSETWSTSEKKKC